MRLRTLLAITVALLWTAEGGAQTVTQEREAYYARVVAAESEWGGNDLGGGTWRVIDWQLEPDAHAYFTYLNRERLTAIGNQRYRTWIKIARKQDHSSRYGPTYRSSVRQLEVDCLSRRIRNGPSTYYDADGRVVDSGANWAPTWSETVPDSQGEVWVKEICSFARTRR
jgi:hypothetical protein